MKGKIFLSIIMVCFLPLGALAEKGNSEDRVFAGTNSVEKQRETGREYINEKFGLTVVFPPGWREIPLKMRENTLFRTYFCGESDNGLPGVLLIASPSTRNTLKNRAMKISTLRVEKNKGSRLVSAPSEFKKKHAEGVYFEIAYNDASSLTVPGFSAFKKIRVLHYLMSDKARNTDLFCYGFVHDDDRLPAERLEIERIMDSFRIQGRP